MTDRREFVKRAGSAALGAVLHPLSATNVLTAPPPGRLCARQGVLRMDPAIRDLLMDALNAAQMAGAQYADARIGQQRQSFISTRERQIVNVGDNDTMGCGVRALLDGCWGFAATPRLTKESVVQAAREAAAVAVAQGIRLPYPDPVVAAETIARRTAANRSSMLQDVQRGAPTEIEAICGAIVQAGEHTGVPTPINRTLFQLIKARAMEPSDRGL